MVDIRWGGAWGTVLENLLGEFFQQLSFGGP